MRNPRALLEAWWQQKLDDPRGLDSFRRAGQDAALRDAFEHAMRTERLLCGIPDGAPSWTHFDTERIGRLVIFQATPRRWKLRARLGILVPALSALGALLTVALFFLVSRPPAEREPLQIPASYFAPRGGEAAGQVHLYLFCVEGEGETARIDRLDQPLSIQPHPARCGRNAELQFALSNHSSKKYLYALGVDHSLRRMWYFPVPGEGKSLRIPADVSGHLLGQSIVTAVNHAPGRVTLHALFSDEPILDEEVARALAQTGGAVSADLGAAMGRDDVVHQAFEIEVTP